MKFCQLGQRNAKKLFLPANLYHKGPRKRVTHITFGRHIFGTIIV